MAMKVSEVQAWLDTLADEELVFIDESGLALCAADSDGAYIEVGGEPEWEFETEDDDDA